MFHYKKVLCLSVLVLVIKQSSTSPIETQSQDESVDLNVDLSCVTNTSCISSMANRIVRALKTKKMIDFGAFSVEPVKNIKAVEGRSTSKLSDIASSNALRVPFGAYSLSLQKSEEYDNYLEISISQTIEGERKEMMKTFAKKKCLDGRKFIPFISIKEENCFLEISSLFKHPD